MSNRSFFLFRQVCVCSESFGTGGFWARWKSRLDPYQCVPLSGQKPDVYLRNAFTWDVGGEWLPVKSIDAGICTMDVRESPAGYTLWEYYRTKNRDMYVRFWMSRDYDEICLLCDNSRTSGHLPFDLLEQLIPSVMLKHDAITFHGVLMEHEGNGIILSAPSGTGKTTHARLWRDHRRALILNGDRATCCLEDGRWIGFSLPWCGSSGECINRDVPLTAFVVLEQAHENSVERLEGLDAFGAIMPNLIYPSWDRELTEKALGFIDDFLEKIPVLRLRCRPDVEAVETLEAALREL